MANSPSARKRARQSLIRRAHNVALRSKGRTAIKTVLKSIEEKNIEQAKSAFKNTQSVLDSLASKGIFAKNKVARHKSRLNKRIKELQASLSS